ncbi:MAG: VOC family protein [Ignavibacteriaceae bacterium]|nr:VOC family protein [Ignavibacteriaceae bacterium]
MELKNNVVGWFEIPVSNMERAMKFYEAVFNLKLERHQMGELDMAWFPFADVPGSPGSLVYHKEFYTPSSDGVLIYFTAHSGDLNNELSLVEPAGGQTLMPKTLIGEEIGYMALFLDTEGNRIALHSRK